MHVNNRLCFEFISWRVQALWRALVIPAFVLAALFAAIQAPEQFQGTVTSLGSTVFSFVTNQPQLASAIVLVGALLLLSSTIVPLLGAGLVFLLVFAPGQLSRLLPPLPSVPTVPSWAVPEPVKSVRGLLSTSACHAGLTRKCVCLTVTSCRCMRSREAVDHSARAMQAKWKSACR